jgi:hypothetical protein
MNCLTLGFNLALEAGDGQDACPPRLPGLLQLIWILTGLASGRFSTVTSSTPSL